MVDFCLLAYVFCCILLSCDFKAARNLRPMRRLFLIRHAKAEPAVGQDDYERALTERGRNDARRIAAVLAARQARRTCSSTRARCAPSRRPRSSPRIGRAGSSCRRKSALYDATPGDALRPRPRPVRRGRMRRLRRPQSGRSASLPPRSPATAPIRSCAAWRSSTRPAPSPCIDFESPPGTTSSGRAGCSPCFSPPPSSRRRRTDPLSQPPSSAGPK